MGYSFLFSLSFLATGLWGKEESESDQGVTSARCGLEGEREHTCLFWDRVTHKSNFRCILGEEGWHIYSLPFCSIHSSFSKKIRDRTTLDFSKMHLASTCISSSATTALKKKGNRKGGRGEDTKRRFYSFSRKSHLATEKWRRETERWLSGQPGEGRRRQNSGHRLTTVSRTNQREEEEAVYRFFLFLLIPNWKENHRLCLLFFLSQFCMSRLFFHHQEEGASVSRKR